MATQQFRGVLAVEGQEANGVTFALGALTWPDSVPLFLGVEGHCIGKVEQIERDGDTIRGDVIVDREEFDGEPFEFDDDGIVGFGMAVHVNLLEREGDDGPFTLGMISAVAATAKPAFRDARATRDVAGSSVWKYELLVDDEQLVAMPAGAELLYVGTQNPRDPTRVTLWARVVPCYPDDFANRRILIRGTGHRVGDEPYVGTVVVGDGALVWHVFDGGESSLTTQE